MRDIVAWLRGFNWVATWSISPSLPHHNALAALSTGKRILTLWGGRTREALGALLLAEPHPGTTIYHIHSLISAESFNCDAFRDFTCRWGQSEVQPYRPGGGFIGYIAHKLLRDGVEFDLYGKIVSKEVGNAHHN